MEMTEGGAAAPGGPTPRSENTGEPEPAVVTAPSKSWSSRIWRRRNSGLTVVLPILTFAALILLWWAFVTFGNVPVYLLPAPQLVLPSMIEYWPDLWQNTQVTLLEIVIGFGLTVVIAIPMGLAIAISRPVKQSAYPLLVLIQLVPKIAIAPLFLIWFGWGIEPKVFIVTLLTFFPLLLASIAGFGALDTRTLYLTRTMGASTWQTFRYVRLPSAMPFIFSGLKVSATIAATAAIVAEFVGGNSGLGYRLLVATQYLDLPLVFAILVLLTLIGLGLNYIIEGIEYFVMPWQRVT